MRVIITGGTGLIGRALADSLARAQHEVIVLSRNPTAVRGFSSTVRLQKWDGHTPEGWGSLIDQSTGLVNLAGENIAGGRWTDHRKRRLRDSRLSAAAAIVRAIEEAKEHPAVVIQASAVGYYGPHGAEDLTELSPPGHDFLARLCIDWEAGIQKLDQLGVRHVKIRTGVVLSTNGGALPKMLLPFRLFVGGRLGSGRQQLPWIHLDDEVGAISYLLSARVAWGPFNLTGPQPVSNAEFAAIVGRVMGRPAALATPAPILKLFLGEMATVLLDGQRALPKRLVDLGYKFHYSDAESALRNLL